MIEVIPASQLKVGDVFSTDGYKVTSVYPLNDYTERISVEVHLDASGGISKHAVFEPTHPCPIWRELTPAGRAWAEAQPAEKRIPAVALNGVEAGWPEAFCLAAIKIANEQGAKEVVTS